MKLNPYNLMPRTFGTTSLFLPSFLLLQSIPTSSQSFLSCVFHLFPIKQNLNSLTWHTWSFPNTHPNLFFQIYFSLLSPWMLQLSPTTYHSLNILSLPSLHIWQLVLNCPINKHWVKQHFNYRKFTISRGNR